MSKNRSNLIGNTKRSTDAIINEAIAKQNKWLEKRRAFTTKFLKAMNFFDQRASEIIKPSKKTVVAKSAVKSESTTSKKSKVLPYWFPISCGIVILIVSIFIIFKGLDSDTVKSTESEIAKPVQLDTNDLNEFAKSENIEFDIVRINRNGNLIVAGKWLPNKQVSILMNDEIVATESTNNDGDFVYAPVQKIKPGNYTIALISANSNDKSKDQVFIYVSEMGYKKSISLLMTEGGSTLLQTPQTSDSDLTVSKIDYLNSGRIVVSGNSLPRLRVSATLNGHRLGWTRVSDHKTFGMGYDIDKLTPGADYTLVLRLHDGDGKTIERSTHKFKMPKQTGASNTFYTVRNGDSLWIIARNFLRDGLLFSIIADKNHIENPDLIFPDQELKIPVQK